MNEDHETWKLILLFKQAEYIYVDFLINFL